MKFHITSAVLFDDFKGLLSLFLFLIIYWENYCFIFAINFSYVDIKAK